MDTNLRLENAPVDNGIKFIRIDKKSLVELKIASLYSSEINENNLHSIDIVSKPAFSKCGTPFYRSVVDKSLFLNKDYKISFTLKEVTKKVLTNITKI